MMMKIYFFISIYLTAVQGETIKDLGTMAANLDVSMASGTLKVDFPAISEVTFEANGYDGVEVMKCNKTWVCPAAEAVSHVSGAEYESTFLTFSAPALTYDGADSSKKYALVKFDFGHPGAEANMINWACVNTPAGADGKLDMESAECYSFLGGPGLTYEKKSSFSAAWQASPAMNTQVLAATYAVLLFEQATAFPAVNVTTGNEILRYGADLFLLMAGDQAGAFANGGFYMYNFTTLATGSGFIYKAQNNYKAKGLAWSAKVLLDVGLPWFVPPCDTHVDSHCKVKEAATPAPAPAPADTPAATPADTPADPAPAPAPAAATTASPEAGGTVATTLSFSLLLMLTLQ